MPALKPTPPPKSLQPGRITGTNRPRWAWRVAAGVVLIVAVAAGLFLRIKDYGLLGWDTYPLIITSRIQTWSDLGHTFTQRLMAGRYAGAFYRPVLNLTLAADYALGGLHPRGYQLTNILALAGFAAALAFSVRRLIGGGAQIAPLVALVFFLLHPTHAEVLPVPSRRPESLCGMFMLLAVATQLSPRALAARRPVILPALFTVLAIASKETGFILPALVFVAVAFHTPDATVLRRVLHALVAAIPHALMVGLLLAVRYAVLGGLGGHGTTKLSDALGRLPSYVPPLLEWLLVPQPTMVASRASLFLIAGLVAGLIASGVLAAHGRPAADSTTPGGPRVLPAIGVALLWLVLVALTYAAAGTLQPWYMPLLVAGLAMFVGAMAEWLVLRWRRGGSVAKTISGATLVLLAVLLTWQARYSPLVHPYAEWPAATDAARTFLAQLGAQIADAPAGSVVRAPPLPFWAQPRPDRPVVRGAAVLTDYSIQAWVELTFPGRRIRVQGPAQRDAPPPSANEVVVLLARRLEGF